MKYYPALLACAAVLLTAPARGAALVITEVMSNGTFGTGLTSDWFELTNTGATTLSLANFKMDDNSFAIASAVALTGISSIAPGESVLYLEIPSGNNAANDVAAFRTFWGGTALTAQVGTYSGTGVSLSNNGDGVVVFDGSNAEVTRVSFNTATANTSFGYDPAQYPSQSGFGPLSVAGQNGAANSTGTPTNVGSPGAVPEPTGAGLLAVASCLVLGRRSRRRA